MVKSVTKAVIPVAGYATRFLPQTKAMPKQMLPLVDKPVIQYIVELLVRSGIEDIIMVTNYHERAIEDHFDRPHQDLIETLVNGGESKMKLVKVLEEISEMANFVYVRQKGPYGNGTPLLNVRHLIGDEPFIYTWGDEFVETEGKTAFEQLIEAYREYKCTILGGIRARDDDDYLKWGFCGGKEVNPGEIEVETIIEKPGKEKAPSDLGNLVGYVFTPEIFEYIGKAKVELKPGGELWYNDAIKLMLAGGSRVIAKEIKGVYRDAGTKLNYMKTIVEMGLKHQEIGEEFARWLKEGAVFK